MNKLNESQIELIKSVNSYVNYCLENPNIQGHEIYNCILKMNQIGNLMIENKWPQDCMDEYISLESMKKVVAKLLGYL